MRLSIQDNGGVWQQHNPWLGSLGSDEARFAVLGDVGISVIRLRRAGGDGQFISRPTPLKIARAHGFDGPYLSADEGVELELTRID